MDSEGELSPDYKEILINYAMRHLLGSDKGRYIMDALREDDPLNYGYIMLEATRRFQTLPKEDLEKPTKLIQQLEDAQAERARKLRDEVDEW